MEERRRKPRVRVAGSAGVTRGARFVGQFAVENLSESGVLLRGGPELEEGALLDLVLQLAGRAITLAGEVVRFDESAGVSRFAIAFRPLPPQVAQIIREVVEAELERTRRPARVLVLGESRALFHELERDLAALGYAAEHASTVDEARAQLEAAAIDAALIDFDSGDAGPFELLMLLRKMRNDVHRVLVAAGAPAQPLLPSPVTLPRPWTREMLAEALSARENAVAELLVWA